MGGREDDIVSYEVRFPRQALLEAGRDVRFLESRTFASHEDARDGVHAYVKALVAPYRGEDLPPGVFRRVEALREYEVVGRDANGVEVDRVEYALPYAGVVDVLSNLRRKDILLIIFGVIPLTALGILNEHVVKLVLIFMGVYFLLFVLPLAVVRVLPNIIRTLSDYASGVTGPARRR